VVFNFPKGCFHDLRSLSEDYIFQTIEYSHQRFTFIVSVDEELIGGDCILEPGIKSRAKVFRRRFRIHSMMLIIN
jgi:hypothetical protein